MRNMISSLPVIQTLTGERLNALLFVQAESSISVKELKKHTNIKQTTCSQSKLFFSCSQKLSFPFSSADEKGVMEINEFKRKLVVHSFSTTGRVRGQDLFIRAPSSSCWGRKACVWSQINLQKTTGRKYGIHRNFYALKMGDDAYYGVIHHNIEAAIWYRFTACTPAIKHSLYKCMFTFVLSYKINMVNIGVFY